MMMRMPMSYLAKCSINSLQLILNLQTEILNSKQTEISNSKQIEINNSKLKKPEQ